MLKLSKACLLSSSATRRVCWPGPPLVMGMIRSSVLKLSIVRSRMPSIRMNLPWCQMTSVSRLRQGSRSTSAASSSAFGTEPSAASAIRVMNGVHIQQSTASTAQ